MGYPIFLRGGYSGNFIDYVYFAAFAIYSIANYNIRYGSNSMGS